MNRGVSAPQDGVDMKHYLPNLPSVVMVAGLCGIWFVLRSALEMSALETGAGFVSSAVMLTGLVGVIEYMLEDYTTRN